MRAPAQSGSRVRILPSYLLGPQAFGRPSPTGSLRGPKSPLLGLRPVIGFADLRMSAKADNWHEVPREDDFNRRE